MGVHAVLQAQPRCGQGIGGALHECRRAIGTRDKPAGGNGVTTSNRPPPGEGPPQAMGHPFDQGAIWHARFVHGAQPSKKDYPRNERETSWLRRLRGRDTGDPAPPARTRTGRVPAAGAAVGLASAPGVRSSAHASTPPRGQAGSRAGVGGPDLGHAGPADTPACPATPMAPRAGPVQGPVTDASAGAGVALHPRVARMSPAPSGATVAAGVTRPRPGRRHPCLEPWARPALLLARGAACDPRPSRSVCVPEPCAAHHGAPAAQARMPSTAAPAAGLLR